MIILDIKNPEKGMWRHSAEERAQQDGFRKHETMVEYYSRPENLSDFLGEV